MREREEAVTTLKHHYQKIITLSCFLLMFCNVGLPSTSFGVYQPYIVALPGMGDSAGSVVLGVRTFTSLICMIFVGRFYAHLDCRKGCFVAALCTAAGFTLFGFAQSFSVLCLAAVFAGAGYGLGGMIGCTLLINRWYRTDVGTAIGIVAVGSGAANMIIPLVAEAVIRSAGLSVSFWSEAVLALVIGVIVLVLLRNRPQEMGLTPYVNPKAKDQLLKGDAQKKTVAPDPGVSLPDGTRRIFFFAMMLVGAACVAAPAFLSVLLVSEGFTHAFGALMISVSGLALSVSKFCTGKMFDKLGAIKGTVVSLGMFTAGLILVALCAGNMPVAVTGVVLLGAGVAIGTVGIPIWSLHLSTPAERGDIVRKFQVGYAAGSFLFNLVPGVLMDALGSYAVSYALMGGMTIAALFIIVAIYSKYHGRAVRTIG